MPRKQRTLEQQLADAQTRQQEIRARLQALEVRKKQRDSRTRSKAELSLMRVVLGQMTSQPDFRHTIADLVTKTPLRSDEQDAIQRLIASLPAPSANQAGTRDSDDLSAAQERQKATGRNRLLAIPAPAR